MIDGPMVIGIAKPPALSVLSTSANWASDAPAGTATTSTGSEIMIVGDFRTGYTIVDRIAMTMEIVQHFVWAD
jgi:HK97 family phage major capsid protein